MDKAIKLYHKQIDKSHPHMVLMRLVRSCMSTSTPCIEEGIKHCHVNSMKTFGKMIAKMEKAKKQHVLLHESKLFHSFVSTKHAAFFVFHDIPEEGQVTIVFRQSYCKCNWITNLQWMPREQDSIHSGFHYLSETIIDELKDVINNTDDSVQRIYFTGMSLGGAMCALMAYRMVNETGLDSRKIEVVQFASPKIGLRDWANRYDLMIGNSCHYHSTCDLFANSPPSRAGKYQHVGKLIHVDDFGFGDNLCMRAHTKILGLSFASGMNIPLAISMVLRGDNILKSWERIMEVVDSGV